MQEPRARLWLLLGVAAIMAACDAGSGREAGSAPFAGETLRTPPRAPGDRAPAPPPAPDPAPEAPAGPAVGSLAWALAGPWRPEEERALDPVRKPEALIAFMGITPQQTVVEAWPGGGWHAAILAPYLSAGGGRYVAALPPAAAPDAARDLVTRVRRRDEPRALGPALGPAVLREAFRLRFKDPRLGPTPALVDFGPQTSRPTLDPPADAALTVDDVHVWMALGMAEKAFADLYALLRPGGALTVVEARAPESAPQDPRAATGYVRTSYVVRLAEEAGFTLEAQSAVLANPKDDADHPFGVWTLAPFNRTSPLGEPVDPDFDRAPYDAVGEPDRMALLFRKPEDV